MERTAEITLRVTWDDEEYDDPRDWGWATLVDVADRDKVRVLRYHANT